MLPAVHLFGIHIAMYAFMAFVGLVAYVVMFFVITKREGVDRITSNRMLFFSVLGFAVLVFSALVFNSIFHSIEAGELEIGGITWLGGVVGLFPVMVLFFHRFVPRAKGDAVRYFSMVVPGIVLGHAFGRVGCFFGGCCYGKVTNSVFGVSFPAGSHAALDYPGPDGRSLPVYPTQLFEAAFELLLFIFMIATRKKWKKYDGAIYMIAYGVFRFFMEFLRGDDRGSTGFFLSPSQLFCVLLLIGGVLVILFQRGVLFKKMNARCEKWRTEAERENAEYEKEIAGTKSLAVLKELYALKKAGVITEQEYNEKKQKILKDI